MTFLEHYTLGQLLQLADKDPMLAGYVHPNDTTIQRVPIKNGEQKIVGFFTPRVSPDGSIRTGAIYVAPEYRKQGWACKAIANWVGEKPARAFIETDNTASIRAFECAGFVKTDWEPRWGGGWWYRKNKG